VSVRPRGSTAFGTRVEIKNLNSFRFLQQAIDYEVRRQIELIEDGGRVVQETRLYDPDRDETRSMRSKEDAADYRYFPDPDLLPLVIAQDDIERVRQRMPELPTQVRERFIRDYALSDTDATTLTAQRATALFYESLAAAVTDKKAAANWVMGELSAALNADNKSVADSPISVAELATLINRITDGTINGKTAKDVFGVLWRGEANSVDGVIEARGLKQISDTGAIEQIVDDILAANATVVAEFKAGKEKALQALVGQAMKATRGKANPQQLNDILRRKLNA
jgi:aspartyl-tRNA(Asn)/glutamyl-tRNA(Gln) amidotransferase subunit B